MVSLRRRMPGPVLRLSAALAALLALAPAAQAAVPATDLGRPAGPLVRVAAGADLSCQVQHDGDGAFQFAPQSAALGDCGTLVAVDGRLYAPAFGSHDGGTGTAALGSYTAFEQRGQVADGAYAVTTTVDLPGTSLQIVQRDSYAPGQDGYLTDVTVRNSGSGAKSIVLYRAGDCHMQGPGTGYGFAGSPDGAVGCSAQPGNAPLDRVIQWIPVGAGSSWMQGSAAAVWSQIASRTALPNQCAACPSETDNAAAIAWALDVAGGGSETRSHWTVFSPVGRTGIPAAVALPEPPAPPPVEPVQTTVQGTTITFTGPRRCVAPPDHLKMRITAIRKRRIARDRFGYQRRVRILRVEFFVDGERRHTDRRAAFKALLSTVNATPGEHTIKARVLLQPLRQRGRQVLVGQKFRRTLTSVANVCG